MCSNLLTFNINVAFLGGACFVVSLIDFYLKESEHDGLKDLVKFLAVFMNLAVMFCVCKAIVSLYCTSLILDGMIAVSSIVSVIVTACLSFYYVKNQLGNMKTTFSKIILTRLSGLLLFSSFLFRLGGTYCVVILALNKIPFIASGSFVYYALTTGLTLSFMAQYMVNIVRSYIFNDMSIFKDEDKEESSALTESVAHFANSYKPAEGFFTWLFSEDGQDKAAIPAGLNKD
jgi:putative flippase GtrA